MNYSTFLNSFLEVYFFFKLNFVVVLIMSLVFLCCVVNAVFNRRLVRLKGKVAY